MAATEVRVACLTNRGPRLVAVEVFPDVTLRELLEEFNQAISDPSIAGTGIDTARSQLVGLTSPWAMRTYDDLLEYHPDDQLDELDYEDGPDKHIRVFVGLNSILSRGNFGERGKHLKIDQWHDPCTCFEEQDPNWGGLKLIRGRLAPLQLEYKHKGQTARVSLAAPDPIINSNLTENDSGYDLLLKLLLVGDSGVGKSALLMRYTDDLFNSKFITTIGIDFRMKMIECYGSRVKLQIWDTAGQERFRTITQAYFRGSMGILLVYDSTDEKSFTNIRSWMKSLHCHANTEATKVLVATKCDLRDKQQVTEEAGKALAAEYGIEFYATSAKQPANTLNEVFEQLTCSILQKREMALMEDVDRVCAEAAHFRNKAGRARVEAEAGQDQEERQHLEALQHNMVKQATLVAGALEKAQQGMTEEERDALPGDQVDEVCKTVADSLFIPVNILLEQPDAVKRDYVKAARVRPLIVAMYSLSAALQENKMKTDYHKVVRATRKERTEMIEKFKTLHPEGYPKVLHKLAEWFIEFEGIDQQKIDNCTEDFSDPISGSTTYMQFLLKEWLEAKEKLVE